MYFTYNIHIIIHYNTLLVKNILFFKLNLLNICSTFLQTRIIYKKNHIKQNMINLNFKSWLSSILECYNLSCKNINQMHNNTNVSFNNFIKINEKHKRILIDLLIKCSKSGLHLFCIFFHSHIVYTRFKHYFSFNPSSYRHKKIYKRKRGIHKIYTKWKIYEVYALSDHEYRLSRIIHNTSQRAICTANKFKFLITKGNTINFIL